MQIGGEIQSFQKKKNPTIERSVKLSTFSVTSFLWPEIPPLDILGLLILCIERNWGEKRLLTLVQGYSLECWSQPAKTNK